MSFVRSVKPNNAVRRKRSGAKKKPAWDDSVQDLSVHRASLEDQIYRKNMHLSKNGLTARLQKLDRNQRKSKSPKATAKQMAVIKEILYDKQQLHDVLSKSDEMMAVVKDLFGDDPRRFAGFPNVTSAPNSSDTTNLVNVDGDVRTQLEALSDSVMNTVALNTSTEEEDSNDEGPEAIVYEPRLNLDRFQQFLAAEEENASLSTISGAGFVTSADEVGQPERTKPKESTAMGVGSGDGSIFETPPSKHTTRSPKSAVNDTAKVKRSKKQVSNDGTSQAPSLSLTELKQVLMNLQGEITELENQTGHNEERGPNQADTFSGYTMGLVDSVSRLTRYLRQTEIRLRAETTVREQLTQDVAQLATVVDALTSDIIVTQEEYSRVLAEFSRYKSETQSELEQIKMVLKNAGLGLNSQNSGIQQSQQNMVSQSFPQSLSSVSNTQPQLQPGLGPQSFAHPPTNTTHSHPHYVHTHPGQTLHEQPGRGYPHQLPATLKHGPVQPQQQGDNATLHSDRNTHNVYNILQHNPPVMEHVEKNQSNHQLPISHQSNQYLRHLPDFNNEGLKSQVKSDVQINASQEVPSQPVSSKPITEPAVELGLITPPKQPYNQDEGFPVKSAPGRHNLADVFPSAVLLSPPVQRTRLPNTANIPDQQTTTEPTTTTSQSTAVVNVPRPVRLVQTNVPINLDQQQQQGQRSFYNEGEEQITQCQQSGDQSKKTDGLLHNTNSDTSFQPVQKQSVRNNYILKPNGDEIKGENPAIAAQIAELNRQHEEAQRRLQTMILQQQQQSVKVGSNRSVQVPGKSHHTLNVYYQRQTNNIEEQISPNVSPISERSSSVRGQLPTNQHKKQAQDRIHVSMPRVDLDLSEFSDISPSPHIDPLACQ